MTAQVVKIDSLPAPVGDLHVVWRPDPVRYDDDQTYRQQVQDFVHSHIQAGSVSDAVVLADEVGTLALRSTSFLDHEGQLNRDPSGRTVAESYFVKINSGTVFP